MQNKVKVISPHAGFQERFVCSNVDFIIGGSAMGVGKTFGALLMAAEHLSDPNFRMVFIRRNIGDLKTGGGGADEANKLYGSIASMKISDSPRLSFPAGSFIDFTHMADQTPDAVLERVKGWQYSCIYVDEATGFEWSTIRILMSRNRSQAAWSGKFRCTCNPKRSHWLRYWVDWYVDDDGYPIPERDGIVRYFYVAGEDITDVVLGSTKEEVYSRCQRSIDTIVEHMNQGSDSAIYTYRDLIKSYTFLSGRLSENTSLLKNDASYMGSVAAMGERQAQANLLGCWNVDDEDTSTPIHRAKASDIADNSPRVNGELWLTCDLADTGTDNCIALVWDGLHIVDMQILEKSTPAGNCNMIEHLAARHGVGENHIIYDAQRAAYMIDRFPNAMGYLSFKAATGLYARVGERLKDVTYLRLVELINNNSISVSPEVAQMRYTHQNLKKPYTFTEEFIRECSVVNFDTTAAGKYKLWGKKAMNRMLGGHASMDLLDCIAMRLWPLCNTEYGQELSGRRTTYADDQRVYTRNSIYDDSTWF